MCSARRRPRGYEMIALARSAAAARSVAALGAQPIAGDLDQARGLDEAFAAARADALVCLASLGRGHGPAIVAAAEEAGIPPGGLRLDDRGDHHARPADQAGAAGRRAADPRQRPGLDDPAADDDLRRPGRPQPVPAAGAAAPDAGAAGARRRRLPAPAGPRGRRRHRRARRAARARGDRLDVQRGRARADPVRGPAAHLRPGGAEQDPAGARPAGPAGDARARLRAGSAAIRGSGWSSCCRLAEDKAFGIDDAVRDLGYAPCRFDAGIRAEARMLGLAS